MEYFYFALILVFVAYLSFCIGWRLSVYSMTAKAKRILEEAEKIHKETSVTLKMERYNDGFLFYNKETNEYIGSANSKEEIISFLEKNYSNKSFYLEKTDMDILDKAATK